MVSKRRTSASRITAYYQSPNAVNLKSYDKETAFWGVHGLTENKKYRVVIRFPKLKVNGEWVVGGWCRTINLDRSWKSNISFSSLVALRNHLCYAVPIKE